MNDVEIFYISYLVGAIVFGILFLIVMPITAYKRGKEIGKSCQYSSMGLSLGGALFFGLMIGIGYLESGPYNYTHSGFEGVIPGIISLLGVAAILVGIVWRVIVGVRK